MSFWCAKVFTLSGLNDLWPLITVPPNDNSEDRPPCSFTVAESKEDMRASLEMENDVSDPDGGNWEFADRCRSTSEIIPEKPSDSGAQRRREYCRQQITIHF